MLAPPPFTAPRRYLRKLALDMFGVSLSGDLHERAVDLGLRLPLSRSRSQRIAQVRSAGVLFIHVPKCAGMAISQAIYGMQVKHASIRWYRRYAPGLDDLPSFAVVRDPVARFVSAYRYATRGGSADNRISDPFRQRYCAFRCIDDALDHVEAASSVYQLDHVFRPQQWYVSLDDGQIDVDLLFRLGDPMLDSFLQEHAGRPLRHVNSSVAPEPVLTFRQHERIRRIYSADVDLYARSVGSAARISAETATSVSAIRTIASA